MNRKAGIPVILGLSMAFELSAAPKLDGFRFLTATTHLENGAGTFSAEITLRDPEGLGRVTTGSANQGGDSRSTSTIGGEFLSLELARKEGSPDTYLLSFPLDESAASGKWTINDIATEDSLGGIHVLDVFDLPPGSEIPCVTVIRADDELRSALRPLTFSDPVSHTYNPLDYAWERHCDYLERFGQGPKRVLMLGMNPGGYGPLLQH